VTWPCYPLAVTSNLLSIGSETSDLSAQDLREGLFQALGALGPRQKVLCIPPDITRHPSRAGELTRYAWEFYGDRLAAVLPALGTHTPMTPAEIRGMFGDMPPALFHVHDWREGFVTLGEVPAAFIREQSEGKLDFAWPAQIGKLVVEGGFDLILSFGQVVPAYSKTSGLSCVNPAWRRRSLAFAGS